MYIFKKTPTVLITLSFICIFVVSCGPALIGWPGRVWKCKSCYDNSTVLWMEPAGIGSWLKLSLYKSSVMIEDDIILIAIVFGANDLLFSEGESLYFNIDGTVVGFKSIERMTDIKTTSGHLPESINLTSPWWPESPKNYLVSKAFIKRLIDAEKVIVRIDLKEEYHGKKFVEGKFSTDFPSTARPGFRKFYKKLESFK